MKQLPPSSRQWCRSCGSGQSWLEHRHIPDHTSLSVKGDHITVIEVTVIEDTRRATQGTNPVFRELFRNSHVSDKREQEWQDAVRYAGTGTPPLRLHRSMSISTSGICARRRWSSCTKRCATSLPSTRRLDSTTSFRFGIGTNCAWPSSQNRMSSFCVPSVFDLLFPEDAKCTQCCAPEFESYFQRLTSNNRGATRRVRAG
jgi:hypothetical protein